MGVLLSISPISGACYPKQINLDFSLERGLRYSTLSSSKCDPVSCLQDQLRISVATSFAEVISYQAAGARRSQFPVNIRVSKWRLSSGVVKELRALALNVELRGRSHCDRGN